jgi:hypothetical protein
MNLTKQEQAIVDYHRDTIATGKVGRDEKGRPVTVFSTGIELLDASGRRTGKFVSVPGFIDNAQGNRYIPKRNGRVDEDFLREYWAKEIQANVFPVYNSSKELNKRSQEIHKIMDDEEQMARRAQKRPLMMD